MAITIEETFQVGAPVHAVWEFMLDPEQVATCIPGAELTEVVDDRTFLGQVKVRLGAITASYQGQVRFESVDEQDHVVEMVAEGRETSGATAKGTMSSHLRPLSDSETEVVAQASVDLTGRMMQVGGGMVRGVAHQLFQQFVARVKERLEPAEGAAEEEAKLEAAPAEPEPVQLLPVLLRTIWSPVAGFFRRLTGRRQA